MKCSECGETVWIEYPIYYKQCKNCGHFQEKDVIEGRKMTEERERIEKEFFWTWAYRGIVLGFLAYLTFGKI